jgi:hypothetical protein
VVARLPDQSLIPDGLLDKLAAAYGVTVGVRHHKVFGDLGL